MVNPATSGSIPSTESCLGLFAQSVGDVRPCGTAKSSSEAKASRNRHNAQLSTGPVTAAGKAISRTNAVRHGLTANPAVGAVEETEAFETLLGAVADRLRPADVIEDALVHRIAVAIWRQRRAVRAETALSSVVVRELVPQREEVQRFIERITRA